MAKIVFSVLSACIKRVCCPPFHPYLQSQQGPSKEQIKGWARDLSDILEAAALLGLQLQWRPSRWRTKGKVCVCVCGRYDQGLILRTSVWLKSLCAFFINTWHAALPELLWLSICSSWHVCISLIRCAPFVLVCVSGRLKKLLFVCGKLTVTK